MEKNGANSLVNVVCRQLSDTTNIIALENSNLLVLNNAGLNTSPPATGQVQLMSTDEATSCTTPSSGALIPIGTAVTTIQPHVLNYSMPLGEQNSSTPTVNVINSKLDFESSKKISNLLRYTDLLHVSSSGHGTHANKKHIKQMMQIQQPPPPPPPPPSSSLTQLNEQDLQSLTSHVQISNVDLIKLIEYKVRVHWLN